MLLGDAALVPQADGVLEDVEVAGDADLSAEA